MEEEEVDHEESDSRLRGHRGLSLLLFDDVDGEDGTLREALNERDGGVALSLKGIDHLTDGLQSLKDEELMAVHPRRGELLDELDGGDVGRGPLSLVGSISIPEDFVVLGDHHQQIIPRDEVERERDEAVGTGTSSECGPAWAGRGQCPGCAWRQRLSRRSSDDAA